MANGSTTIVFFGAAAGASGASEGRQKLHHRRKAVRRDLGQRPLDGPSHRTRHAGAERGDRRDRGEELARQHRGEARPGEGRLARQQLVEDAGETVLVGPRVYVALAFGLLGTHVGGRPDAQAGAGQLVAGGEPAIPAARAMPKSATSAWPCESRTFSGLTSRWISALPVGVVERFAGLPHQAQRLRHRERALANEPLAQGLAIDVRHDVERAGRHLVGAAGIEEGEDVGVLESRQDLDLAEEALGDFAGDDLRAQDLDGDRTVVLAVAREIHQRHPAAAQLALDRVAVAYGDRLEHATVTAVKHR